MPLHKRKSERQTVRHDKFSKQSVILYCFGALAVVWLGLLIAPCMGNGLVGLIENFGTVMSNPFRITLCEDSLKTVLILLLVYGVVIAAFITVAKDVLKSSGFLMPRLTVRLP